MSNESIIQEDTSVCYRCGKCRGGLNSLEWHHVFGGSNRKFSEYYKLKVKLCGKECHKFDAVAVHQDPRFMQRLHEEGQRAWEEHYGTREEFRNIFGKSWL